MISPQKYYSIMERPFLALSTANPGYMNMGFWPANSLLEAQKKLIELSCSKLLSVSPGIRAIIEAGSGWGGSRPILDQFFPEAKYLGINISHTQIDHARKLNAHIPQTDYLESKIEDVTSEAVGRFDALIAIEAAIHFDKKKFISAVDKLNVKTIVLAEILVKNRDLVLQDCYVAPALHLCSSQENYRSLLDQHGYRLTESEDISDNVFSGMSTAVNAIEPDNYDENPAILEQLKAAFASMSAMHGKGAAGIYDRPS